MKTKTADSSRPKRKRKIQLIEKMETVSSTLVRAVHEGDWLPAQQLHEQFLVACRQADAVHVDVGGVDFLNAAVLQILLAVHREQQKRRQSLHLLRASSELCQWLAYAGAQSLLA